MNGQFKTSFWYSYYTLRLYDTLKSCPYRPFLYVYPLATTQEPIQCLVYPMKPPHTYAITSKCLQHTSDDGQAMVQRLHQAIHTVASKSQTNIKRIPFENNTIICIWFASKKNNLATVRLQLDSNVPCSIRMHFEQEEKCRSTVQYINKKQQQQYRISNSKSLFLSNPRFAQIPIDQWYLQPKSPSYMVYDQLQYTVGDWSETWFHIMFSSYTKMQKPKVSTTNASRQRVKNITNYITERYVDATSPYKRLSPETTLNTIRYLFQKHQKGVFIRILDNKLDLFLPFVRHNFTNDYYTKLHLSTDIEPHDKQDLIMMKTYETQLQEWDTIIQNSDPHTVLFLKPKYEQTLNKFLHLEYKCAKRFSNYFKPRKGFEHDEVKRNPNRRQWMAHNHFFNTALYYDNPDIAHFKFVFEQLVQHRSVPDIECFLQLRDYPVVHGNYDSKTNQTTLYQANPDLLPDTNQIQYVCNGGLAPILTHSTKDGYYDIPLPTRDDIEYFAQMYFIDKCNGAYVDHLPEDSLWVDWKDKTISKAVFRGSATGRGTTIDVNQRLNVMHLSHMHPELIDARVIAFNDKFKVEKDKEGLQKIDRVSIQKQVGAIHKGYRMDYDARKKYKYNLCLDGHIRADRLANEMRTGSLIILPTTDGHRLWYEPFLTPLAWEDIQRSTKHTPTTMTKQGFTHITITQLDTLPQLIQWLQANDTICQAIVNNAKAWLFDTHKGHYLRASPKTSFMYDYLEGVLRSVAKQYISTKYILPLALHAPQTPRISTSSKRSTKSIRRSQKSLKTKTGISKSITSSVVGIVVGFRDSEPNGVRTQQLKQFCAFWNQLSPPEFRYTIVIAEQATQPQDKKEFDLWWQTHVYETSPPVDVSVHDYIQLLERHYEQKTLPTCISRNIAIVHNDCWLACGVMKTKRDSVEHAKQTKWTHAECYRRTGEQKFNLGVLKNAGYAYLRKKYASKLSHVVFTDIDMLPDHQLAPYYAHIPQPNEIIALATRGTVYDHFTIDNMPIYTLMSHPLHHHTTTKGRPIHKARGGKRPTQKKQKHKHKHTHHKPSFNNNARHMHKHTRQNNYHSHHTCSPTTLYGRKCVPSWMKYKFDRFVGASISFSKTLFETINGYPNSFWGWGGEDDELKCRFKWVEEQKLIPKVKFTVPPQGRVIDLEIAQPVTIKDKLAYRVKELQKNEKLSESRNTWESDGLRQLDNVCKVTVGGSFQGFVKTIVLNVAV